MIETPETSRGTTREDIEKELSEVGRRWVVSQLEEDGRRLDELNKQLEELDKNMKKKK